MLKKILVSFLTLKLSDSMAYTTFQFYGSMTFKAHFCRHQHWPLKRPFLPSCWLCSGSLQCNSGLSSSRGMVTIASFCLSNCLYEIIETKQEGWRQSCLTFAILECSFASTKKNEAVLLQSNSFFQKN